MSSLLGAGKAKAAMPDLAGRPRQLIFLTPVDTALQDFLHEAHQLALAEPALVEHLQADLDRHAKKKKLLRLADAQFLAGQTPDLPKLRVQLREIKMEDLELASSRPRTEAYVVYLFLRLRGFNGGCKDQQARLLLEESITLRLWLEHLGLALPPASTLSELLNAVSNQTRLFIQQAQLRAIRREGLDDCQKSMIDSTAVEAHSARPTDSTLLVNLLARIRVTGGHLHRLGLPDLKQVGLLAQEAELRRYSQQSHFLNGKARGEAKRRQWYFQLLRRVRRLHKRLERDLAAVREGAARVALPPSRRLLAEEALGFLAEDLAAVAQAAAVCERRIMLEEKVPAAEKIISLSDADASFIVKGGWNSVVGYRPQLARSGGGFVTALCVPRGNAADSPQLVPMVQAQIANTGVVPALLSVDDGYSSEQGRALRQSLGVPVVSISGAKGKKIIAPAEWKSAAYRRARAERSGMESLMFTLQHRFEFGELRRRTQENVEAELFEKVLAYNLCQMIRVRERRARPTAVLPAAA